ncbi:MAG: molecular chaperone DnaJ [Thermoleophilia bacterium]|nr:molecular chaperone DnaJ [Thermoleophilia bacterium]
MKRDYYEVLGVTRNADEKEIKTSFRSLARKLHPDVNKSDPDTEAKFKEAAEAYEVLNNPESRATYDRYGFDGLKRGGFSDFSQFSFEDIFRSFFGDGMFGGDMFGGQAGAARGGDIAVEAEINLGEAASGVTREVEYEAIDKCPACEGSGAAPGTDRDTCKACNGVGQVRSITRTAFGQFVRQGPCSACGGAGSTVATPCDDCGGHGLAVAARKVSVEIPQGISDGQSIRMTGKGSAGEMGAAAGDLYVHIAVAEHEQLKRDGNDLIYHLPLTVVDAALGATLEIPTLEGDEDYEIKPGTQPGEVKSLRGRGMPFLRGRGRGSLKIIMEVMVPRHLSQEQKDLLHQFADASSDKNYSSDEGLINRIRAAFS